MASEATNNCVADSVSIPLGNNIYLYEPAGRGSSTRNLDRAAATAEDASGTQAPTPSAPPSLIILCTWLGGATTSRVAKYTSWYRTQYPTSHVLLIRTVFLDISARSFATVRARLQPARAAITMILQETAAPPHDSVQNTPSSDDARDVLLHVFSHGGCNTAIQLARSMHEDAGTLLHDRLRQIVFDSCPGDAGFEKAYNAALISLPRPLTGSAIGAAAAYSAVTVISALQSAGLMRSVEDLRRELNDPELFGRRATRLYLVSRADRMVAVEDVLSHAQEAKEGGYEVGIVVFDTAPHCALILEDAQRYWDAIRRCWNGTEPLALPCDNKQEDYGPQL